MVGRVRTPCGRLFRSMLYCAVYQCHQQSSHLRLELYNVSCGVRWGKGRHGPSSIHPPNESIPGQVFSCAEPARDRWGQAVLWLTVGSSDGLWQWPPTKPACGQSRHRPPMKTNTVPTKAQARAQRQQNSPAPTWHVTGQFEGGGGVGGRRSGMWREG